MRSNSKHLAQYNQTDMVYPTVTPYSSGIISRPIVYEHTVYIDEELVAPSDWRYELETIRNAAPEDIVIIRINSGGGSDSVMGAFVKAIAESKAHVIGSIEHTCASAATIIWLACDEYILSADAEFMCHTASLGYGGKQNNFHEYALFLNEANKRLIEKYYEAFLSEEEINNILKGSDIWLGADEIIQRLEKRAAHFKAKQEKEQLEAEEAMFAELSADMLSEEELKGMSKQELIDYIMGRDVQEGVAEGETPENQPKQEASIVWKSSDGMWSLADTNQLTLDKDEKIYLICDNPYYCGTEWDFYLDEYYEVDPEQRKELSKEMDHVGYHYSKKSPTTRLGKDFQNYLISIINEYLEATGSDKIPTL